MSYNAGNHDDVKDGKSLAKILELRERNGIVKICNDPDCRYALAQFLEAAKVFSNAFNSNPTDHAFNEGFRNAGLYWLNKALLHDADIMSKIQADKDSTQKLGKKDDNGNSSSDSDTISE